MVLGHELGRMLNEASIGISRESFQNDSLHPGRSKCRGGFKAATLYPQRIPDDYPQPIPDEPLLPVDHAAVMQYLISRETRNYKAGLSCFGSCLPGDSQRGGGARLALCATHRIGRR